MYNSTPRVFTNTTSKKRLDQAPPSTCSICKDSCFKNAWKAWSLLLPFYVKSELNSTNRKKFDKFKNTF